MGDCDCPLMLVHCDADDSWCRSHGADPVYFDDDEDEGGDFDLPDDDDDPVMVPFECPKRGGACYETACLHWNECRDERLR